MVDQFGQCLSKNHIDLSEDEICNFKCTKHKYNIDNQF